MLSIIIVASLSGMDYKLIKLPERDELARRALSAGFTDHFLQKTEFLDFAGQELEPMGISLWLDQCTYHYMQIRGKYTSPEFLEIVSANLSCGKKKLKEELFKEQPKKN